MRTNYRNLDGWSFGIVGEDHRDAVVEAANRYVDEEADLTGETDLEKYEIKNRWNLPRYGPEVKAYGKRAIRVYNPSRGAIRLLETVTGIVGPEDDIEEEWNSIMSDIDKELEVDSGDLTHGDTNAN